MLQDQLQSDLKQAMINKDETKVSTLRMLLSEIKYAEIAKSEPLEDKDLIAVIQKEVKKRREAAAGFRQGDRAEQAAKEEAELAVLQVYLPAQISDEELTKIVQNSINEVGATSMTQMGQVIGKVMAQVGQTAEASRVSALVKESLLNKS